VLRSRAAGTDARPRAAWTVTLLFQFAGCVIVSTYPRMMLRAVKIGAVTPSCPFNFYFFDSLNN
jgi:hypothetical protein